MNSLCLAVMQDVTATFFILLIILTAPMPIARPQKEGLNSGKIE